MSSMAYLSLLLLISFALTVGGQGLIDCGSHQCLGETGASCVNGKCKCPAGEIGDGRIECANPDDSCLCTLHGDPHLRPFHGPPYVLPLPCGHLIAQFEITTDDEKCRVHIVGVASYGEGTSNSLAAWESRIDVTIGVGGGQGSSFYSATIQKGDQPVTFNRPGGRVQVDTLTENGFTVIDVSYCKLRIKFKADTGFFSLLTPAGNTTSIGLCGGCQDAGANQPSRLDGFQKLQNLLDALSVGSPVDASLISPYPQCTDLSLAYRKCKQNGILDEIPLKICGSMYARKNVRNCMTRSGSPLQLLDQFKQCLEAVCSPGLTTCTELADFFQGCHEGEVLELQNSTFCSQVVVY